MIIVFCGTHAALPLAAAYLCIEESGNGAVPPAWWNSKTNPLAVMGKDRQGNIICCISSRRRLDVYQRAIAGIAGIFKSNVMLVNADEFPIQFHMNYMDKTKWLGAQIAPNLYGQWLVNFLRPRLGQIIR